MDFLRRNMPGILKTTSSVCGLLSACGVPGAGIVKAGADFLSGYVGGGGGGGGGGGDGGAAAAAAIASMSGQLSSIQLQQNQLKGMVGELSDTVKSGFDQLNASFGQVFGQLEAIEDQLAGQRETMSHILEVVTDLRYKAGIEKIEAAYNTLMKGSHNLKSTLDELRGFIFELNTENSQNLNSKKMREYLELVRREKGKKAAEELGSYVVTVKAEYLIIVSLHYSYMEDHKRVQREYEDFNRDAMEIIKYAGLADIYDGEKTADGLKHGKGSIFYKSGARYEGEWRNDVEHGHGSKLWADEDVQDGGGTYVGEFRNGVFQGHGKRTYGVGPNAGDVFEGEYLNGKRCGKGRYTWANGSFYEGEWLNNCQHGQGQYSYSNGASYVGEFKNDMRWGKGKFVYSNGRRYEGEFKMGEEWGEGTTHYKDGGVYVGQWVDGKRSGKGRMQWADGDVYDGFWLDDERTNRNSRFIRSDGYTLIYQ